VAYGVLHRAGVFAAGPWPGLREEAGLPGMVAANLNGLFAPAGLPGPIVELLAEQTRKLRADPGFIKLLVTSGFEPTAASDPEAARRLVADELRRWTPIMKATNFKME
jgi:tripartite-type tricarboxylate transporter receptor subunit TctC